jgi:PIN domain nuclease of toxin-antitoxin system
VARYVIDTHALVFALVARKKLGMRARRALERVEAGRDEAWIPAAAGAEIILLHQLGRIEVGFAALKSTLEEASSLHFLPLDLDQLDQFAGLASIHDPFDRLIVGAARSLGAKLISRDETLTESGLVEVVW